MNLCEDNSVCSAKNWSRIIDGTFLFVLIHCKCNEVVITVSQVLNVVIFFMN